MEYHETVNTLERLRRLRPKLGTRTTASLLEHLGNPHEGMAAIQIAGSNGKGSTARVLDRILREAGLSVGLYTSPDLNDFRERVRVRGRNIPKREVVRFVEEAWPYIVDRAVEGDGPTFFEVCTALALWHFDRENVDCAVLEVGIGGRYDATSVVDPVAAAVTSVSLEHTDILGSTVEEIARDKAQVAPTDAPLVTGATGRALETIREEADVLTVGSTRVDSSVADRETVHDPESGPDIGVTEGEMVSSSMAAVSVDGPDWRVESRTPLLGQYQAVNIGIAGTLARQVADVTEHDIAAGIRNVHWPGRFEVMDDTPLTVLDGAHNPDACAKLSTVLERFDYDDLSLVFGAMRDKDHRAMCRSLPSADRVFLAEPAVNRAEDTAVLSTVFERETDGTVEQCGSVLGAVDRALQQADAADCVVIAGSLYTVAEARDRWTRAPIPTQTDTTARARSVVRAADVPAAERPAPDQMVHRTIRFHARREQATLLRTTMLSLGGTCSVSEIAADEHIDVVMTGTLAQFRDLVRQLRGQSEFNHIASQLNHALGIETNGKDESSDDYPWENGTAMMGILNVTPDSFHDSSESVEAACARAEEMVAAGADILDIGAESTRPGADPVTAEEERERLLPVLDRLTDSTAMISVDTRKPAVAEAALEAGVEMINDVSGLADAAMRSVVAEWDVPVVVMHSLSTPVDPKQQYSYGDVVDDVLSELTERVLLAERAGIDRSRVVVDPGLGFGKRATESFELLDRLDEFSALGTPIMVGHSHKSMFEHAGCGPDERLAPTIAATTLATERGADIVRVHDVAPNAAAVATAERTTRTDHSSDPSL
ncbi:dihydropteroate synthase [Halocatena marina]|uniref:Probable bifunctional folylpolyglutamate synthase/dihydropteroate synthase n=1 Tax=Halocatena marina TaxID=2934937 RepID=A0ABD5YQ26_9EURY|nr:dihydropteroate synthase [Halocatena marina]